MNKKEIRKELLNNRSNIKNRNEKELLINQELFNFVKNYRAIGVYASINDEVNIDQLINQLLKLNKVVVLPKVIGDVIEFYQIKSLSELNDEKSKYHIREPMDLDNNRVNKNMIDVIIVPGVGFDKKMNRLGYGKGYYDKYLSDYSGIKIGVCFIEQLIEQLPVDDNDIKMTSVIYK